MKVDNAKTLFLNTTNKSERLADIAIPFLAVCLRRRSYPLLGSSHTKLFHPVALLRRKTSQEERPRQRASRAPYKQLITKTKQHSSLGTP
jgi:hypothetical protein